MILPVLRLRKYGNDSFARRYAALTLTSNTLSQEPSSACKCR